jgi:hypothetical protein
MKPLMALLLLTSTASAECTCTSDRCICREEDTLITKTFTPPTTVMIISKDGLSITINGKNIDDMRGPELLAAMHRLGLAVSRANGVP